MFLKKTTLLSLATAAAVVATSAGTYAAWDTIEAKTTAASVTFRKPVTVEVGETLSMNAADTNSQLGDTPISYSASDVAFTVVNENDLATKLTITPVITDTSLETDLTEYFTIKIKDKNELEASETVISGSFVDTSLSTTTYDITVTAKDDSVSMGKIAGKTVKIELTGTLGK